MKSPVTPMGLPEVAVAPGVIFGIMILTAAFWHNPLTQWGWWLTEALLCTIGVWSVMFFRDPHRNCPSDPSLLLSPADGKVTDIEKVQMNDFIQGPALRIGRYAESGRGVLC